MRKSKVEYECRRRTVSLVLVAMAVASQACGSDTADQQGSAGSQPRTDAGESIESGEPESPVPSHEASFYRGYLAEQVSGDIAKAEEEYSKVLGAGAVVPNLASRASLSMARWAADGRKRLLATDLSTRAVALATDAEVRLEASTLRDGLIRGVRVQDVEVRGPEAGRKLEGVPVEVANQFALAEEHLSTYHKRRLKFRLEELVGSLRSKRYAKERALRNYREVAASELKTAVAASEFRIASISYDYALTLSFDLPGELSPEVASSMRSSLRSERRQSWGQARTAYQLSIAAAKNAGDAAKDWGKASAIGLASVEDLLRER